MLDSFSRFFPKPDAPRKVSGVNPVTAASAFLALSLMACAEPGSGALSSKALDQSGGEDTNALVDDSGETDPVKDSESETGGQETGGEETGDPIDTGGEVEEPECDPQNTSTWPTTWSDELGTSFRDNGGDELSGLAGIPGATVDLPAEVIYGAGDKGTLYEMDGDFTLLRSWTLPTAEDIEGIALDPVRRKIFSIDEDYSDVDEWEWLSGSDPVKGSTDCTLNIPSDTAGNLGIEGFTYLSADEAPASWSSESWADSNGYLLAGSQTDSNVGVFPIGLCTSDAVLDPVLSIPTGDANTDIAGLATLKGNLYTLKDSARTVSVTDLSTQVTTFTYTLPTDGQEEAIWLKLDDCDPGNASMYIGDDVSGVIYRYVVPVDAAY